MFVLAWLLLLGKLGRSFRTIRESEIAAVSSGVNLTVTKTLAFGISAFFAGVAGSLYAIVIGFVNPDTFSINLSLLLLIGVVVGGLGSLVGVVFGALFIEYVPLYAPDILSWVEKPFGSPLDPSRRAQARRFTALACSWCCLSPRTGSQDLLSNGLTNRV